MKDGTYRFIADMIDAFLWGGELVGEENLPEEGPAVFVANHLGSTGPIGVSCSMPLRLYPWIISDTIDPERAPDYLRVDFVEKELKLSMPLSLWLAQAICWLSVPLLRSIGCVAVYSDPEELQEKTFTQSVSLLKEGKYLLIFPEDPQQPIDQSTKMTPFKKGFARLGEYYYQETGERLDFYPLAVYERGKVMVGKPVTYNPINAPANERLRLKSLLEEHIRKMYMGMSTKDFMVPLPN
jgi:hypothetical protein